MNCNEFNDRLADLFDKKVAPQTWAEMKEHMASCTECRNLYESLQETAEELEPQHSPLKVKLEPSITPKEPMIGQRTTRRWWNVAASVAIFAVGVLMGSTHFISESAHASSFSFDGAIQSVRNVGSYDLELMVRTTPNENFAYMDPKADFMPVSMKKQTINDKAFWRVEKEGGRTIVCDGYHQYMWDLGGSHLMGNLEANFLENYRLFLEPTSLLNMQQMAQKLGKNVSLKTHNTDSTLVVTTSFEVEGTELSAIFNNTSSAKTVTIENVCTKADGLLRSLRVWIDWNGQDIELVRSTAVKYNVAIDRETLLSLPQGVEWTDLTKGLPIASEERLALLQAESPVAAAQRILGALVSGKTEEAEEALFYYKSYLPILQKKFAGAKMEHFTVRTEKDYVGVYVFYNLTDRNGKTETCHIALRNDNNLKIWVADGGL